MTETTRRHVRHSRSDWQQLIDEQARSGLSQTAFCAARALSVKSFQHWKRQLAATAASPSLPWLELGALPERPVATGWDLELELELGAGVCPRLRRCRSRRVSSASGCTCHRPTCASRSTVCRHWSGRSWPRTR